MLYNADEPVMWGDEPATTSNKGRLCEALFRHSRADPYKHSYNTCSRSGVAIYKLILFTLQVPCAILQLKPVREGRSR
ncbi:uncharacterized protein YALI1_F27701g [Yarrowia lipolytica]|uniref:Uncharacterized protein n=1 Tax=Yarrowia lipolytica TaxID=4952 RepID=A0A1D8NPD1_YARLL|nr:hypothetical protein YALI1_F27701g [Yarrowia lipolytica]